MANEWTLKDKTASDDTHKAIYHGVTAKEIWYKGKKIWDNAPDFWSFAKPSHIGIAEPGWGDNPWRDKGLWVLYRSNHAEDYVGVSSFYPSNGIISNSFFHDDINQGAFFNEWAEWVGTTIDVIYYPYVKTADGLCEVLESEYSDGVMTVTTIRKNDISRVKAFDVSIGATYQRTFPFSSVKFEDYILPPGEYDVFGMYSQNSGVPRQESLDYITRHGGTWEGYSSPCHYWRKTTEYAGRIDVETVISTYPISNGKKVFNIREYFYRDTRTLSEPAKLTYEYEIGIKEGMKGSTVTNSISLSVGRTAPYMCGLRPGQLRGIFSTEPRGKGTQYGYVVNDKRGMFTGHLEHFNIDPTECIDPETGMMAEVTFTGCSIPVYYYHSSKNQQLARYSFKKGDDNITVTFYEKNVVIKKVNKKGVHTMNLYYYKGSSDFGHNWS